jgi:hypothetical protein
MPKTNSSGVPSHAGFTGEVVSADGTVHQIGVHEATGTEVEVTRPHPEHVTTREVNAQEPAIGQGEKAHTVRRGRK